MSDECPNCARERAAREKAEDELRFEKLARRDFEEALDNVREALGLDLTHYLVLNNEVRDLKARAEKAEAERDRLAAELATTRSDFAKLVCLAVERAETAEKERDQLLAEKEEATKKACLWVTLDAAHVQIVDGLKAKLEKAEAEAAAMARRIAELEDR